MKKRKSLFTYEADNISTKELEDIKQADDIDPEREKSKR